MTGVCLTIEETLSVFLGIPRSSFIQILCTCLSESWGGGQAYNKGPTDHTGESVNSNSF